MKNKPKIEFSGVSVPVYILNEIDEIIRVKQYWVSRGDFARQAIIEKIERERANLKDSEKE